MADGRLEIGKMVNTSFEVYKDNFFALFFAGLIATVMTLTIILLPPAAIGMFRLSIRALRGEKVEVGDLFQGFSGFLTGWGIVILSSVGIAIGLILLVVPGIYLSIVWCLAFLVLADDPHVGAMGALGRSRELVKGYFWSVSLALGTLFLILFAASLIPIGSLLAGPFCYAGMAYIYLKLKGPVATAPASLTPA